MIISVQSATLFKRVVLRFLRTFVSGGLAAIMVQLITIPKLETLADLKMYAISIGVGFLAGGFAALDKWLREPNN